MKSETNGHTNGVETKNTKVRPKREPLFPGYDREDQSAAMKFLKAAIFYAYLFTLLLPLPFMVATILGTLVYEGVRLLALRLPLAQKVVDVVVTVRQKIGNYILRDPRNAPLLGVFFGLGIFVPVMFACNLYYQMQLAKEGKFDWFAVYLYHVLLQGPYHYFFACVSTLVHKEGHNRDGFFKGWFGFFFNRYFEYFLGLFYGHVPESYSIGHVKIHHRNSNFWDDVTTTMHYERTSVLDWFKYLVSFSFYWTGFTVALHFFKRGDWKNFFIMLRGQFVYIAFASILFYLNWRFALGYFIIAMVITIIYLGAINWTWHAFVDPNDPANEYVLSITILKGHYNLFNEDFHVIHHLLPGQHWSKAEEHYNKHVDEYAKNQASTFEDTMEFELFIWLITKDWKKLADHFVDYSGKMTQEEKIELLKSRTKPFKYIEKSKEE